MKKLPKPKNYEKYENASQKVRDKAKEIRRKLTVFFSKTVFITLISAVGIAAVTIFILDKTNVLEALGITNINLPLTFVVMVATVCLLTFIIGILIGKFPLKPVNDLISNMNRLASGDFKTRLQFGKTISKHKTFKEIADSFNKLAEELENTETLRADFVNNFSHEFKTPIVSIAGLAKLVNKGNLSEEQKAVYLTAIEEESVRLASMATNVLNLTKVENQSILTDISTFNLSEQIRSCILLLENKWTQKNISLDLELDEYDVDANEELLKQIWINLIDNAIKFSPQDSTIDIDLCKYENYLMFSITNEGSITPENEKKIWNKFYQEDESHTTEGNGIGLAIVKRIVELHNGQASVSSENGSVTFTVKLPEKQ